MFFIPARTACRLIAVVMILATSLAHVMPARGFGEAVAGTLPRARLLELFDTLAPALREKLIARHFAKADFQTVVRADLAPAVVARGSLMAAKNSDVFCTVPADAKGNIATTVKWLVDNGTPVKKGELIVQLDDLAFVAQLKEQKIKRDLAHAEIAKAKEDLDLIGKETEVQLLTCDIDLRTAELSFKKHGNDDADEKDILKLNIERARLNLARYKALGRSREALAQAVVDAKKTIAEVEQGRYRDIEQQIQACRIVAPQDGLAVYFVPEGIRGGSGSPRPIVAQGEPVREGQKLLQIPDLSRMTVLARIPEAYISEIQRAQKAIVEVDAFPQKKWAGQVQWLDTVASPTDFFASDVKVYQVRVALAAETKELKPGMSAEVRIETGRAKQVLVVPVQAVMRVGPKSYCYVKSGQEIRKVEVVPGVRSDFSVEIKSGLKEGDSVLRDPVGVLRRALQIPAQSTGGAKEASMEPARLHVQSVRVVDADRKLGRWVEAYGLTWNDLHALAGMPSVVATVPLRRFVQESRRLTRVHTSTVAGATPELADLMPLPLEAGRFLCAQDMEERRNVAVLGAAVADALFPGEEALGQNVVLKGDLYVVIGVLDDTTSAEHQASIYLPLTTCQSRFGEKIILRNAGKRRAEAVQLSDIYVTPRSPQDVAPTLEAIRELLTERHEQKDWAVRVGD